MNAKRERETGDSGRCRVERERERIERTIEVGGRIEVASKLVRSELRFI